MFRGGHRSKPRNNSEHYVKKNVTWVVVADHQHGRIYANDGPGRGLQLVKGLSFDTHLHRSREIGSDKPSRSFESQGSLRHSIEPRTDLHREEGARFIASIAQALSAAAQRGEYDRLVVIAPPRALGEFRKLLPSAVRGKLVGEVNEDLTKVPVARLPDYVGEFITV